MPKFFTWHDLLHDVGVSVKLERIITHTSMAERRNEIKAIRIHEAHLLVMLEQSIRVESFVTGRAFETGLHDIEYDNNHWIDEFTL